MRTRNVWDERRSRDGVQPAKERAMAARAHAVELGLGLVVCTDEVALGLRTGPHIGWHLSCVPFSAS